MARKMTTAATAVAPAASNHATARRTAWIVLALVGLRMIAGAITPLTFDEAYYWTWSQALAASYYDHPPMVALVIKLGTIVGGDTQFGVRVISILLALPMSWAIYRTAMMLCRDARIAASATLLLNATLMVAAGTIIVTPDAPLMVASAFVLFFLAKMIDTGKGVWWLAVGVATGCALLSKYTALFFGAQILLWIVITPELRRWLRSPWPYLGGIIALIVFSPVIGWNAEHQWVSFIKQLGRARVEGMTLKYFGEIIPTQFGFATPFVFALGVMGLYLLAKRPGDSSKIGWPAQTLLATSFGVIFLYFCWHSLHARVEANWLGPVYPAFAIAAAIAAHHVGWNARNQRTADVCSRFALPAGVVLLMLLLIQANTGVLTGFRRDTTVRSVGVGWIELAGDIEQLRVQSGASCIIGPDYGTTSWLMFYLPRGTCVLQRNQRIRWGNRPDPDAALLQKPALFVDEIHPGGPTAVLKTIYQRVDKIAELTRKRSGVVMETYEIDRLEDPIGDPLDRSLPPELGGPAN
jgi:hypothetical protein